MAAAKVKAKKKYAESEYNKYNFISNNLFSLKPKPADAKLFAPIFCSRCQ